MTSYKLLKSKRSLEHYLNSLKNLKKRLHKENYENSVPEDNNNSTVTKLDSDIEIQNLYLMKHIDAESKHLNEINKKINEQLNDMSNNSNIINESNQLLESRNRQLELSQEKNVYKQKIIYTLTSVILILIISIILLYKMN